MGTSVLGLISGFFGSLPEVALGLKLALLTVSVPAVMLSVILWFVYLVRKIATKK
jgi:hypothetical protein